MAYNLLLGALGADARTVSDRLESRRRALGVPGRIAVLTFAGGRGGDAAGTHDEYVLRDHTGTTRLGLSRTAAMAALERIAARG